MSLEDDKKLAAVLDVIPLAVLLVRYRAVMRAAVKGAGVYSFAVGLATFWAGDDRLRGPSYTTAVQLSQMVSVSPSVLWGTLAMLVGGLALLPVRKVSQWGLYGIVAWSVLFAASFLVSVNVHPLAGVSGVFAHVFIGVMVTGLIVVRIVDRKV